MSMITLEATHLTRKFGTTTAVNNLSFQLKKGQVLGLLGPNGAGKSTTMKMLTGNLSPSQGSIKICGFDMQRDPVNAKASLGYLPEERPLYKDFTVDDYLTVAAQLHRVDANKIKAAVSSAKAQCGLSEMGKRIIDNLSNGYQQRVGIAQAIIHRPMVVILDEPTVGLDPVQIREVRTLIKTIGQEHSVILSTHLLTEVEMLCDQVQIIDQGEFVFNGSTQALQSQRQNHQLSLGFKQLKEIKPIIEIEGVTEAVSLGHGRFRVTFDKHNQPAARIAQAAVKNQWGLYQMMPERSSLEEVFIALTQQTTHTLTTMQAAP